jgi:hypothetical protein
MLDTENNVTTTPPINGNDPLKRRDLNARYGGKSTSAKYAGDAIPPITVKHPVFAITASAGFAFLNAEMIFFLATYYNSSLGWGWNITAIAGVFLATMGAVYASFVLPHLYLRKRYHLYAPIVFLTAQLTVAALILAANTALTLLVGIMVVDRKFDAIAELLRSLALYSIAAIILYHGMVVFVRYVRYLYEREMHDSYKIVTFIGVLTVIVMVITLYLLQFDLGRMGGTDPQQGWLALHLTVRDIVLLGMTFCVFVWSGAALADH